MGDHYYFMRHIIKYIVRKYKRLMEKYYEKHIFKIDTEGFILTKEYLGETRNTEYLHYQPIDYCGLKKELKRLKLDHKKEVFFDYGAGKGRAMIIAATMPFKKVAGIEVSEDLIKIAKTNVTKASKYLKCKNIEFYYQDVTGFDLIKDASILLFYNPFKGRTMEKAIEKIKQSLDQYPRKIKIIFFHPEYGDYKTIEPCDRQTWLKKISEQKIESTWFHITSVVYDNILKENMS